jgi:hypothetical protein
MSQLTIAEARDMPFEDLLSRADALIAKYSKPNDGETGGQRIQRLTMTLEECPDIYRWLQTLRSFFDHWTDAYADQFGMKSTHYKQMRERRDAMEYMASAAKMRYEAASREITVLQGFDETGMPRSRS